MDCVKFDRAKGLSSSRIVGVHMLKNIMIPIVKVIGLAFGSVVAFAVVTDGAFAWPGMDKLLVDSINVLDRQGIVAYLLVISMPFCFDQSRGRCGVSSTQSSCAARRRRGALM